MVESSERILLFFFCSFLSFFFFSGEGPGNSDSRGRFHLLRFDSPLISTFFGAVGVVKWVQHVVSGIWIVLILVVDGRRSYIVVSPTCSRVL
jgi:hypothetical protein